MQRQQTGVDSCASSKLRTITTLSIEDNEEEESDNEDESLLPYLQEDGKHVETSKSVGHPSFMPCDIVFPASLKDSSRLLLHDSNRGNGAKSSQLCLEDTNTPQRADDRRPDVLNFRTYEGRVDPELGSLYDWAPIYI
jgi:hypothetical protein